MAGDQQSATGADGARTRRQLLRNGALIGSTAVAGCQYGGDETETRSGGGSESAKTSTGTPSAVQKRIRTHRMAPLAVRVVDQRGRPVADASVSVTMQRHAFGFGTAVNAHHLVTKTSPGDRYRELIPRLFNRAVLEHRHKWKPWEIPTAREKAIRATKWLLEQGLDVRGHTVIWQRFDQPVVPDDVVEKVKSDDRNRAEYVARRARNHVTDIVESLEGDVVEWDVLNEQISTHRLTDVINPEAPKQRPPEAVRWFERARRTDSEAVLYLNESDVITGSADEQVDDYDELVGYLLENGADLGGVGLQAHHESPEQALSPAELRTRFDLFARPGVALQVTEYDTYGDGWTEERAAAHLRRFLRTAFSHPSVEGFLMWGFWDGAHWQNSAPLFRDDWSAKPALNVYRSLVFEEWWTDEAGRTDQDGVFRTDAILGDHEVSVSTDATSTTRRITVSDPDATPTVEFRISV